jgi:chemotaxis protein CheD
MPDEQLPLVYLKPGDAHFSSRPELVVTVLGSCLSVTMFNRQRGLAGIFHALLPECGRRKIGCDAGCTEEYRHVACSIRRMAKVFDSHGIPRSEIEVKCFGGSDMFRQAPNEASPHSVGRQNIACAAKVIEEEDLKVMVTDLGGLRARKILFYTQTGIVLLKRLGIADNPDGIRRLIT